jgi:hypothetical protein
MDPPVRIYCNFDFGGAISSDICSRTGEHGRGDRCLAGTELDIAIVVVATSGTVAAGFDDLRDSEMMVIDLIQVTFMDSRGIASLG